METRNPASKIRFSCGACGAVFDVAPGLAGRRGICKRCKGPLVVPARAAESPAAPAAAPPAVSPAAEAGSRRQPARHRARVLILIATVGVIGAVFIFSGYFQKHQVETRLARLIALNEAAIARLLPEAEAEWETAVGQTVRLIAEVEGLNAGRASGHSNVLLEYLRRQEEFLRAKAQLDRLNENAKRAVGQYRRHLWHPPAEPQQWPLYLEQTEALRRALRQQLSALQGASATAAEQHSKLLEAEKAAAAQLAAGGLSMATRFGDSAERMQGVLAEIGAVVHEF